MQAAEFEEREYEAPLYSQLLTADTRVWSPGQVFEKHVGPDYSLYYTERWLFDLHESRSVLPGAVMARYGWPASWFRRKTPRHLPNFRLNLFLQAKRPSWGKRPPQTVRQNGVTPPFWKIALEAEQQRALEALALRLTRKALVVYAAPTFHDYKSLFRHTRLGTIAAKSTFPSATALSGHTSWYYNRPGAVGVANPDFTPIEEPGLLERVAQLADDIGEGDANWQQNLKQVASAIRSVMSDDLSEETARRALYFDITRELEGTLRDLEELGEVITAYFSIGAFCQTYNVEWYVAA